MPSEALKPEDDPQFAVPVFGARPVGDRVLDAAAICVQRRGLDATSLEEVAAEAGISRTTLYRRFGNRELLFRALLWERARPFREWSHRVLIGPGPLETRLETVLTHAVIEIQRVGWLDSSIEAGLSPATVRLFKVTHADSAREALAPLIEAIADPRRDAEEITMDDLLEWMADQMLLFASAPKWKEDVLRARLRFFVLPVLLPAPLIASTVGERLDAMDSKLDSLLSQMAHASRTGQPALRREA